MPRWLHAVIVQHLRDAREPGALGAGSEDAPDHGRLLGVDPPLDAEPLAGRVEDLDVVVAVNLATSHVTRPRFTRERVVRPLSRLLALEFACEGPQREHD